VNGKAVEIDGYPMEFWKELGMKEATSKILVRIMINIHIYESGCPKRLEDACVIHDIRGEGG
jgi:hypothetical protein